MSAGRPTWGFLIVSAYVAAVLGPSPVGAPQTAAAAPIDPTALQTSAEGPITIANVATPTQLATLSVPQGRWIAWAKLQVDYEGKGYNTIRCRLAAVSISPQKMSAANVQSAYVSIGALGDPDRESFSLSASWNSIASGASFRLSCNYETGPPFDTLVTASRIRIMALRVGQLKSVPLVAGSMKTADPPVSGTNVRLVGPNAIFGYRAGDLAVPKATTLQTVATLPLTKGNWWVRASFAVVSLNNPDEFEPVNDAECRLVLGGENQRVTPNAGDLNDARVLGLGWEKDRQMMLLDTAGAVDAPGSARIRCRQIFGSADLALRDVRLSAVRAGTLEIRDWDAGTLTTIGTGSPMVIHLSARVNNFPLLGLDPARWLLMAKVNLYSESFDEHADCRFSVLGPSDEDWSGQFYREGTGVPFQLIHQDSTFRFAGIDGCEADGDLRWIKFTAIRLASLTR